MKTNMMKLVMALWMPWVMTLSAPAYELGESLNRRYDQNTYLGAHNAYANSDSHFSKATANQVYDVKDQLDDGVRCLLLDIYLVRQVVKNAVIKFEAYDKRGQTTPSSDFKHADLEIVLAHEPHKWGYSLFSDYLVINRPFENLLHTLTILKDWLDANPNEVVTIAFESYVHEPDLVSAYFQAAGLDDSLFLADRPNYGMPGPDGTPWNVPVHGWPRLRDMVNAGKRLVIFSDNGVLWTRYSGQPVGGPRTTEDDGMPNEWSLVVENKYGDAGLNDTGTARAESQPLDAVLMPVASMNWFPDANLVGPDYHGDSVPELYTWNYGDLNNYVGLTSARFFFIDGAKRYPNIINVDFYHKGEYGGPKEVVYESNFHWATCPGIAATLTISPIPNEFGWRQSANITASGFVGARGYTVQKINYYWYGGNDILGHAEATGSVAVSNSLPVSINPTNGSGGIDGIFHVSAEAVDNLYDRSDRGLNTVQVDSTPPIVAPAVTRPPDGAGDWYTNSVIIRVRALDLLSGARRVGSTNLAGQAVLSENYVSSVTNQYIERAFDFYYAEEGSAFIHFYAEDFAGNVSDQGSGFTHVNLDRTPPVTLVTVTAHGTGSTTLELNAHDTLSGSNGTWFQLDNNTNWITYTTPITLSPAQPHTVRFFSRDVAGNVEQVKSFYVDQIAVGLSASRNPAGFFQQLFLTATVSAPGQKPTGTVTFFDGTNSMSTVPVDDNGNAQLELTPLVYTLPRGTRELTAYYRDNHYAAATSPILLENVVDPPEVQLTSSAQHVVQSQPVQLNATVLGHDGMVPTGTVTFSAVNSASGHELLGVTVPLDENGHASLVADRLPFSDCLLYAEYSGDPAFPPNSSGSALELFVDLAQTFVSVHTSPNPSRFGESVTFSISVSNTPGATAFMKGSVRIDDEDTEFQTLPLDSSGHASFTTSGLQEGNHFFVLTANTVPNLSGGVTGYSHVVLPTHTNLAPFITYQPADLVEIAGRKAAFSVGASGDALTYQWQFNGTSLANETNDTLILTNLHLENAGTYAVLITNGYGSMLSSNAQLTVRLVPMSLAVAQDNPVIAPIAKLLAVNASHANFPLSLTEVSTTSTNGGSVILGSGVLTYTPPAGYVGADAFTYTVTNGHGFSAQGDVLISVTSSNASSLSIISIIAKDTYRVIECAGVPGRLYVLQFAPASDGPWNDLSDPQQADPTGLIQFTDPTSPLPSLRFYRVRAVVTNP
jgi:hypothetical protein